MSKMSKWKNEDTEHVVARADTCFSVPSEKPKHSNDIYD